MWRAWPSLVCPHSGGGISQWSWRRVRKPPPFQKKKSTKSWVFPMRQPPLPFFARNSVLGLQTLCPTGYDGRADAEAEHAPHSGPGGSIRHYGWLKKRLLAVARVAGSHVLAGINKCYRGRHWCLRLGLEAT